MLDGTYQISVNTPLGPLKGNVILITNGNSVQGTFEVMGMKSNFNGFKIANDKCKFSSSLNTPMGNLNYNAVCTVLGNTLKLDIATSQGNINITGNRIK